MLPQFTTMNVIDGQAGLVSYSSLIFYSLTIDNILNIIVLLILAGVTIATLTGNNGIITRASKAKENTEKASENEKINLAVTSAKLNELSTESLTEELKNHGLNIISNGSNINFKSISKGWIYNGEYEKYYITLNGEIFIVADRTGLKVGDYIKYTYDIVNSDYIVDGKYSGYSTTDSQSIKQEQDLTWQILNIDEDTGEIVLISSSSASNIIFQGASGYNNAVYLMNDICKEQYSNKSLGILAKCLSLDNIVDVMNPIGKKQVEDKLINGAEASYQFPYSYYPYIYQYEFGSGIDSDTLLQEGVNGSESYNKLIDNSYSIPTSFLNVKSTSVYKSLPKDWFTTETYIDGTNNPVYNLIFSSRSFLATRCIGLNANGYVEFGLQTISSYSSETINYSPIFLSNSTENTLSNLMRPIVTLNSNILIDLNSGDGETIDSAYSISLKK